MPERAYTGTPSSTRDNQLGSPPLRFPEGWKGDVNGAMAAVASAVRNLGDAAKLPLDGRPARASVNGGKIGSAAFAAIDNFKPQAAPPTIGPARWRAPTCACSTARRMRRRLKPPTAGAICDDPHRQQHHHARPAVQVCPGLGQRRGARAHGRQPRSTRPGRYPCPRRRRTGCTDRAGYPGKGRPHFRRHRWRQQRAGRGRSRPRRCDFKETDEGRYSSTKKNS